jgi:hypothetical protein
MLGTASLRRLSDAGSAARLDPNLKMIEPRDIEERLGRRVAGMLAALSFRHAILSDY